MRLLSIVFFLLTLSLYLRRINAIDSYGYFLANDGVKAGKSEGDGIAVIVSDVDGSFVVAKGFGMDGRVEYCNVR